MRRRHHRLRANHNLCTDTLSSISVTYDADTAHCVLEIICVTFSGTDRAGHPLTNPKTCRNFGPSLRPRPRMVYPSQCRSGRDDEEPHRAARFELHG